MTSRNGRGKRGALTEAAAELFWTKGYGATSLADISTRSGVPLGNVYYYFRTKADLAQAVAGIFVGETEAMISAISQEEADPKNRLAALVDRLSRSLRSRVEHGCPIALCVRDFRADSPEASARAAESFTIIIGFIARELGRLGVRPSQALSTARSVVAEWQGGIALAHALRDATVMAESIRRMETAVGAVTRR